MRATWVGWVNTLANCALPPNCFNPYRGKSAAAKTRRSNLAHYLTNQHNPPLLLVGEALGYRGGRVSGIPFVSQHILETHPTFGTDQYKPVASKLPQREATSTIIWQTLQQLDIMPLLWNAFPFHPHQPEKLNSNRRPNSAELTMGAPFLTHLINQHPTATVVAVGNSAAASLTKLDIPHRKIRHPSHGGKRDFIAGLQLAVAATQP